MIDVNLPPIRQYISFREYCNKQKEKPIFCELPEEILSFGLNNVQVVTISASTVSGTVSFPTTTT